MPLRDNEFNERGLIRKDLLLDNCIGYDKGCGCKNCKDIDMLPDEVRPKIKIHYEGEVDVID